MKEYNIAVYIRLSQADEETGKKKDESNSTVHQRLLLNRFLDSKAELAGCARTEFADDGYSGTNMNRPAFQRMIGGIRNGAYNLVVVKDFSRFSRDYIETGDYLECVFPFLGVRFISVNDGYDSIDYEGRTGGLDVVMKNIIYTAYSRDLSVKIKTAKNMHRKKGEYIECVPPIGYVKDPNDKHNLIIDETGAEIVRRIFRMAAEGTKISQIARMLNEEGVITPTQYYAQKKPGTTQKHSAIGQRWSYESVYAILKRYAYTDALVTNMKTAPSVGSHQYRLQDRSEWIVVKGRYEAIVSEEEYEQVQKVIIKKQKSERQPKDYPLRSLVRCGCCGRIMRRRIKGYGFVCRFREDDDGNGCRDIAFETEADLEGIVYRAIMGQIELADMRIADRKATSRGKEAAIQKILEELSAIAAQEEHIKADKLRRYEKYAAGTLSKEAYLKEKAKADAQIKALGEEKSAKETEMEHLEQGTPGQDLEETALEKYRTQDKLTNDMARDFVEAVYIKPDGEVEIRWHFADYYEQALKNDGMEVDK